MNNQYDMGEIVEFPSDASVKKLMSSNALWKFEIEDIDKKIVATEKAKAKGQLFVYRKKIKDGKYTYNTRYYLMDKDGMVLGRAAFNLDKERKSRAEIAYFIKPEYQSRGYGSVLLRETMKDLVGGTLDIMNRYNEGNADSLCVTIDDDNKVSQKLAKKNGFEHVHGEVYEISVAKVKEMFPAEDTKKHE